MGCLGCDARTNGLLSDAINENKAEDFQVSLLSWST
jgi:hypothetical protein